MHRSTSSRTLAVPLLLGLLAGAGCFDEPPLESGVTVFDDAFSGGFAPNPFENALSTALTVDDREAHDGVAAIRLEVPAPSAYTGGAVLSGGPVDLSRTNVLTFWMKGSKDASFDELGFGLDFDDDGSRHRTAVFDLPVTTEWVQHAIPLPDPARLTAEKGMLYYVATDRTGYTVWLDEVRYETRDLAPLEVTARIAETTRALAVGGTAPVAGLALAYTDLDGVRRTLDAEGAGTGPATTFFEFDSSDPTVATVDEAGTVTAVGLGEATITGTLAGEPVAGAFTVQVVAELPTEPPAPPAAPTLVAADVLSLFSQAYEDVAVGTWCADYSQATCSEVLIGGEPVKLYASLDFAGIQGLGDGVLDVTGYDYLHLDVWTPDATTFRVKLVDFGPNGVGEGGGGDDSEHELAFTAGSTPALFTSAWVSLDIPLSDFSGLTGRANLGQLILSALPTGDARVYVDNVYFHR